MTPVGLIIPDAGPLISLVHAGRLDLVEVFNRPVASRWTDGDRRGRNRLADFSLSRSRPRTIATIITTM